MPLRVMSGRLIGVRYSGDWSDLRLLWQTWKGERRAPCETKFVYVYITHHGVGCHGKISASGTKSTKFILK